MMSPGGAWTSRSRSDSMARDAKRFRTLSSSFARWDRFSLELEFSAVRSRDQEQVAGELREPVGLLACDPQRAAELFGGIGVLEREVELGAHQGERGAQLVTGVGDESAFALKCLVEPREHLVECRPEPFELVAGRLDREPFAGPLAGDRRGAAAHRLDGA